MDTPPTSPAFTTSRYMPLSPELEEGKCSQSSLDLLQSDLELCSKNGNKVMDVMALYHGTLASVACQVYGDRNVDLYLNPSLKIGKVRDRGSVSFIFDLEDRYVIKCPMSRRKYDIILREALILRLLQAPDNNIVPLIGVTYLGKSHFRHLRANELVPALVLQKFELNLHTYINLHRGDIQPDKGVWHSLLRDILCALKFMKSKNIVHRDIKTSNILLNLPRHDTDTTRFYLADFTSADIEGPEEFNTTHDHVDTTLEYCAPELISFFSDMPMSNHSSHIVGTPSMHTDLYAAGLCLLSFITGYEPYDQLFNSSSTNETRSRSASPVQKSQWLINAISKMDPISLNIQEQRIYDIWREELQILNAILVERKPLEEIMQLLH
ncbi:Serine/Threonine protein kinases active-site signature [Nakaseomyces glabratus]|nr:Serine/Threonine protein kinases active-site signature [Nakaseomyces glabratus]